ncbi:MAG: hypothetical protein Q8Q15_00945 [bacterium]|nr:hypothetical protein [bacterium]
MAKPQALLMAKPQALLISKNDRTRFEDGRQITENRKRRQKTDGGKIDSLSSVFKIGLQFSVFCLQ